MKLTVIIAIIIVLGSAGCKHESTIPEPRVCTPDSTYFVQQVLPIFQSSCAVPGCHDAEEAEDDIILDSYFNIMDSGELTAFDLDEGDIYELITEKDPDDRMPPNGFLPLTDDQIDIIENWILQGALNISCEDVDCNEGDVTFSGDIKPMMQNRCRGCHNGNDAAGDIELVTYDDIRLAALSGALMGVLLGEEGYEAMPQNAFPMPDCQISMVQKWIDNGTPND
jgi:hypothetical protein